MEEVLAGVVAIVVTHVHADAQHGLTPKTDCGPASGVVLSAPDEPTLYLAGDTVWYEDVLAVCQAAPWTHVVASHMEAVNHGNVSRTYLRTFVDQLGVGSQVLIPKDGETLEF